MDLDGRRRAAVVSIKAVSRLDVVDLLAEDSPHHLAVVLLKPDGRTLSVPTTISYNEEPNSIYESSSLTAHEFIKRFYPSPTLVHSHIP
jgi:hypothetical protein